MEIGRKWLENYNIKWRRKGKMRIKRWVEQLCRNKGRKAKKK